MERTVSAVFRLHYRRRGWNTARLKTSQVFLSMRSAVTAAGKLEHATKRYDLEPIEEMWVQSGAVMWNDDLKTVEKAKRIDADKPGPPEHQAANPRKKEPPAEMGVPLDGVCPPGYARIGRRCIWTGDDDG